MPEVVISNLGLIFVGVGLITFIILTISARRDFNPDLRPLSAYESINEQAGQAIESGGRMHISLGDNSLIDEKTATTLAGLAILDAAAESSVIGDQPPIATTSDPTTLPVLGDTIRRAYSRNAALDQYESKSARLVAFDSMTLAAGVMGIVVDDDVRANILIGSFGSEVALMAEAGSRKNIPQTIGSDQIDGQAVAYGMADHALLGEELYVSRAYINPNPADTAGLATQDILRWIVIGLIVFGVAMQSFGITG